jgi:MscS family membrane protein
VGADTDSVTQEGLFVDTDSVTQGGLSVDTEPTTVLQGSEELEAVEGFVDRLVPKIPWLRETSIAGVENYRWSILLICVLIGLVAGRIVRHLIEIACERIIRKRSGANVGVIILRSLAKPASGLIFTLALNVGVLMLDIQNPEVRRVALQIVNMLYTLVVGYGIYRLVDVVDHFMGSFAEQTDNRLDDMLVPMVRKSLRVTIVIIVTLFVLENFLGSDKIGSLLMSLGVGGLAVALAAQDTLKNFFGSLMILLDKPFQIGDRIVLKGHDGAVEEVGFRSCKIRTLDGHLVSIPNSTVVNEDIRNIAKRPHIKRVANITITYDTPPEKVERAVEIIRELLDGHEGIDEEFPPRVFFSDFNDWALNILVIYWYHPPEYWNYLEFSQKFNLEVFKRFNEEGIDFAFPTQTLYMANDDKRQLAVRTLSEETGSVG